MLRVITELANKVCHASRSHTQTLSYVRVQKESMSSNPISEFQEVKNCARSYEESVVVKETESNDEVLTQNQYGNTLRSCLHFREVTSFFMYFQVFSKVR